MKRINKFKLKELPLWIEHYVFNLPCYLYHEICHWVFGFITFCCGVNSFPKLRVLRWANWEINATNTGYEVSSHFMCVNTANDLNRFWNRVLTIYICSAPAFGVILLFVISPWYLCVYYITQIQTLWLSYGDYQQIMGNNIIIKTNNKTD